MNVGDTPGSRPQANLGPELALAHCAAYCWGVQACSSTRTLLTWSSGMEPMAPRAETLGAPVSGVPGAPGAPGAPGVPGVPGVVPGV